MPKEKAERLQRDDSGAGPAASLRAGAVVVDRNDVAVSPGQVALDNVAVVVETAADEMGEIGARVAARCECRLHRAVSWVR